LSPSVLLRRFVAAVAAAALFSSVALPASSTAAWAQTDPYKQHMDNGVKLFADKNYPAAVEEFSAAYEARPNANPLVNIALCDKEMFRYPQAIAALVKALSAHGATMDAADKKAAEDAIKGMSALLGKVTVAVSPPGAKVTVDGEDVEVAEPVLLGPGKHKVLARADGYTSAEATIAVASGREETVTLSLVAEKGTVTVEGPDHATAITIDDLPVGQGRWTGMLSPGQHVVRLASPNAEPYRVRITVTAGVPLVVTRDRGGEPLAPPPKPEDPSRRGFYVMGMASMLLAATHPPDFPVTGGAGLNRPDYGAGYGLRAGYQVNRIVGFEASYEHSSIFTYASAPMGASTSEGPYYRIVANRVIVGMRFLSPGDTVRFVGTFGGGFTSDEMFVSMPACRSTPQPTSDIPCYLASPATSPGVSNHTGIDALALVEAAIELDIDRVLLDFGAELQIQSTGNLQGGFNHPVFNALPLINGGPSMRFGYRFW